MKSFFEHSFDDLSEEVFDKIFEKDNFFVERIISRGQRTPDGEWLSQERAEFVILLRGYAELIIKENMQHIKLQPGDYLIIPPKQEHRVEHTSENEETYWLAVHYDEVIK